MTMEFRNAAFTANGYIDMEISHPVYGWIPFTASPDDVEPLGPELFAAAQDSAVPYAPEPIDLDVLTESLCAQIDTDAENARKKYITAGDGQAMTYQRKVDQARAYLAATDPVDADYPALSNEVGITGADCAEVATVIMTMFAAWEQIGDQIEQMRLARKKAIREAATFAEKQDAYAAAEWP